jgi:hypothetical protein
VGIVLGQRIEDVRRHRRVGAVVERQGDEPFRCWQMEQDLREPPGKPADHGTGTNQASDAGRAQPKEERNTNAHHRLASFHAGR